MEHNYNELLREYHIYLAEHEKSHATIQKYVRELVWFLSFLQGDELTKAKVLEYWEQLQRKHQARNVNANAPFSLTVDWLCSFPNKLESVNFEFPTLCPSLVYN